MAVGGPGRTRIYTRTGDAGETGLVGGLRIAKDSERIHAFGTLDELGAHLGLAVALLGDGHEEVRTLLKRLGHELHVAQAEVATPPTGKPPARRIESRHVERLEKEIDRFTATIDLRRAFVVPGGRAGGAQLHVARTVARRAERALWGLHAHEPVSLELMRWANRMSDLLFVLALSVNRADGFVETPPDYTV